MKIDRIKLLYQNPDYIAHRGDFFKKYSNRKHSIFDILLHYYAAYTKQSVPSSLRVLDVGCGTGTLLKKVKLRWPASACYGLDIVKNPACDQLNDIHFEVFDGHHFPVYQKKFDIVFCTNTIYHVADKSSFIQQLFSLLQEEGHLFLTTKSSSNLPALRALHHKICLELNFPLGEENDHTRSFTSENGASIIKNALKKLPFVLRAVPLMTSIVVDNKKELLSYIQSMPMWSNPASTYRKAWRKKLSACSIFFDIYKESIFHITHEPTKKEEARI